MKKLLLFCLLLVVACAGLLPQGVQGQGISPTAILFTDSKPGDESLTLNVLFTVLDNNGQALSKDKVQPEGGGQAFGPTIAGVAATVAPATTPIKIALVIDASGSMKDEIADVRQGAINFVRKTPPNAEIAVYKFSDEVEQVQGFTKKDQLGLVENAILSITNVTEYTGNTCIYKATFKAINDVSSGINRNVAVRPAVVLFTDGEEDDTKLGCGEIKEPQVVTQSRESGVIPTQVHTIGLCVPEDCSKLDEGALISLAEKTNGATIAGKLADLDGLFEKILSTLNQQWMATANIKPKKGQNTISFMFNAVVNDQSTVIPLNLIFESDREYGAPPAKVAIAERSFDENQNIYTLKLTVTNPEQVKQLTIVLRDATGNSVHTQEVSPIKEELMRPIPASGLKAGSEFAIEIKAVDINGRPITDDKGELPVDRGKHEPAAKQPINFQFAQPPELNVERTGFVIKLNQVQRAKNVELIYNVSITEHNRPVLKDLAKGVFDGSNIVVMLPSEEIELLRKANQPKEYALKVTLIDLVGNQSQTKDQPTTVVPPQKSTFMEELAEKLRSPIVLSSILVMFVVVAGVLVVTSSRKRTTIIAQPLYTGKTVMPAKPVKRPANELVRGSLGVPLVSSATEIDAGDLPPSIKINIVATPELNKNTGREINRFPCVIGRENSAFVITGDKKISRQHAEIVLQGNQIIIKDLESANGTFFVVRDLASEPGMFVERKRLPKGGASEWDNNSLIRLGPHTVLELKPQGLLDASDSHTIMHDDEANRTQIER